MTLNKRKPARRRLNWVDWILLGLAFFALLTAGRYFWRRRTAANREAEVYCLMRVPSVDGSLLQSNGGELIPEGSVVRSENGSTALGSVCTVAVKAHMTATLQDGEVVWQTDPAFADLEILVKMHAVVQPENGLRVQDLRIAAGGRGNFCFGNFFAAGAEMISVEVAE